LTGFTKEGKGLNVFLKNLEDSKQYQKVSLQSTQAIPYAVSYKRTNGRATGNLLFFKLEIQL